jgi:sigma-B regulation protein RsbQ
VVLYDLAGAGPNGARSYDAERHATLEGYADDLLALLDELGIRRCAYVGHSVSGMVAALAAVARPSLFSRLVLIAPSPRYLNDAEAGYVGGFEQADLDGIYAGMSENFGAWTAGIAPLVAGVPGHPAADEFARTLFSMRPDIALRSARAIFESDLRRILPRLRTPAVIVQSRGDMAVPLAVVEYLRDCWAGSVLEMIEAEGHLPQMTAPAEVVRVLEAHL